MNGTDVSIYVFDKCDTQIKIRITIRLKIRHQKTVIN